MHIGRLAASSRAATPEAMELVDEWNKNPEESRMLVSWVPFPRCENMRKDRLRGHVSPVSEGLGSPQATRVAVRSGPSFVQAKETLLCAEMPPAV